MREAGGPAGKVLIPHTQAVQRFVSRPHASHVPTEGARIDQTAGRQGAGQTD